MQLKEINQAEQTKTLYYILKYLMHSWETQNKELSWAQFHSSAYRGTLRLQQIESHTVHGVVSTQSCSKQSHEIWLSLPI